MDQPEGESPKYPRAAGLRPAELLDALRNHAVEYVVIGGFALAPHGYVRATKDLDIVPAPSPSNLTRLAAALHHIDARVDLGDIAAQKHDPRPDAGRLIAGGNWVFQTRFGRLDVMQDVPGLRSFEHLSAGAVEVNGTLFAGYDELISMKVASGREEALRDIGALEAARRPE